MARDGVTFDQVKAAAEGLLSEGREPSIRAVRERLRGTGSPNTIHRHLTAWRQGRPESPVPVLDLPATIVREINNEIQRAVAAARADATAQLAQARTEAGDLAAAGETLEAERDRLLEQLAAMTRERDTLAGKAHEQAAELVRLAKELEGERRAVEDARIQLAQLRLEADGLRGQQERARETEGRLRVELQEERQARARTERDLAATAASKDSLADRLADLQTREEAARHELGELRSQVNSLRSDLQASAVESARLAALLGSGASDHAAARPAAGSRPAPRKPES